MGLIDAERLFSAIEGKEGTIEIYQKLDALYKPEIDSVHAAGGRPVTIIGLTKEGKENGSLL